MPDPLAQLDSPGFATARDPKGMYDLALRFPSQCREALRLAEAAALPSDGTGIRLVVVTGLGGSAAGGDFARALFEAGGRVPCLVNRDYGLPHFVGSDTLVIATSYSGNTEETLAAYADALRKGARLLAVTSGGELARRAAQDGVPVVRIPAGQPPRTAMGFMLVPVLVACARLGLLPAQDATGAAAHCEACLGAWRAETPSDRNEAKQLAAALHDAMGAIYGLGGWQSVVASRWRGQVNENAKQIVLTHAFPELDHNEIIGWEGATRSAPRWTALVLQDGEESDRMRLRAEVTEAILAPTAPVRRVTATGPTLLARMLSLALLGDFVSLYLAALNGEDPYVIRSIDRIKDELGRR
ncbi:MAG TPA: bifunctional phosphoglucose/phosphomannose isomerase [Gemmatimonadales bacterium]|nr:bifunctional phosphoglucose/phosphomannose isomerase [Gemmatimonadales bacterium]